jgi:hypothetical protein
MLNPTAVAGGRAAGAAFIPTNYRELYEAQPALDNIRALFQRFTSDTTTAQSLLQFVSTTSIATPLVMLCMVEVDGRSMVLPLHRARLFAQRPEPTSHDEHVYAMWGDFPRFGAIGMVRLRSHMFDFLPAQECRTMEETDVDLQVRRPDQDKLLPPPEEEDDTEILTVRQVIPVPPEYIPLVLHKPAHDPVQLWRELVGAIQVNENVDACRPLIQWMQVALTLNNDTVDAYSLMSMGNETTVFPPWRSPLLEEFRQHTVDLDFAHTVAPAANNDGRLTDFLEVMRRDQERERVSKDAERRADKAPALPSDKFPWATKRFLKICGVDDERDLPPVYAALANATKQERRLCLQEFVEERRQEVDSAGAGKVVVTKEVHDMIVSGLVGDAHGLDDLTVGLQPFTCGFGMGTTSKTIQARVDAYDTSMLGHATPTMAEQIHFSTKEILLPGEPYIFQHMLNATSVIIDVAQGCTHANAIALRRFVKEDVPRIILDLNSMDEADQLRLGNLYPRMLREVQLQLGVYYGDVLGGRDPPLPRYEDIQRWISSRRFRDFPELPARYLDLRAPNGGGTPGAGGTGTRTPAGAGGDPGTTLGTQVPNEQPTRREWQTQFAACGKTVTQLRPHAPKDGQDNEICLSYHLKGVCYTNCGRRGSHKVLTGVAKNNMNTFVGRYCTETSMPRPPPASAGEASSGQPGESGTPTRV